MPNNSALHSFYTSKRWRDFRKLIISERKPICTICGKIIINLNDIEVDHYPVELTVDNMNNPEISLNPDNVRITDHDCHNIRHGRFGKINHGVFIIYGPPLSGKKTFVRSNMQRGDIVVDIDSIYRAISFMNIYDKPDNLSRNVFAVRDILLDNIKTRTGKWQSAWVIGGYPEKYKRDMLAEELGAETIYIEATKEECIERLTQDPERKLMSTEWIGYINKWFDQYIE